MAAVSTALRPFYFLVHPDLFGTYPEEQGINENSLKTLNQYLHTLIENRSHRPPDPVTLPFYLKPRTMGKVHRSDLKSIKVKLIKPNLGDTVVSVLKKADLPTDVVKKTLLTKIDASQRTSSGYYSWQRAPRSSASDYEEDYDEAEARAYAAGLRNKGGNDYPLERWLKDNIEKARENFEKSQPTRLRVERVRDELCRDFEIGSIDWEPHIVTATKMLNLYNLDKLLREKTFDVSCLKDRAIVFCDNVSSGLSLDGRIMFYSNEPRYNWMSVIKSVPAGDESRRLLPNLEESISQAFRGIRIERREFQPITCVQDYRRRLRLLLTNVNDYRTRSRFPESWPDSLSSFKMCIENESCSIMLTPKGEFIVPANASVPQLVAFVTENLSAARTAAANEAVYAQEEKYLIEKCIRELGLISIEKVDGITSKEMIACCNKLLQNGHRFKDLTHGNCFHATRFYEVKSDGGISFPVDWVDDEDHFYYESKRGQS